MRVLVVILALMLAGCNPGIEPDFSQTSQGEQEKRASLVLIGVIEKQFFESQPFFRVADDDEGCWKVLRRDLRVETVVKGSEKRKLLPVYEVFQTCGASGDWNATAEGRRHLFLLRMESGRYRVVQDWWRSIYEVHSGPHARLPLGGTAPFWERVALMMWWIRPGATGGFGFRHMDPSWSLGFWRTVKLQRGLLRHPNIRVRLAGCEGLLHLHLGQDECWDEFSEEDRKRLNLHYNMIPVKEAWKANRRWEEQAFAHWDRILRRARNSPEELDLLRLFTAAANQGLRKEFCRRFLQEFPNETEHGCPADRERPATVVTEAGDVPYPGYWPE